MRILPALLLLPVLVLTGSAAIANDDSPASPQPAIVSPVTEKLTIESLAGIYKQVINEQWLAELLGVERRMGLSEKDLKELEEVTRAPYEKNKITIYADGKFDLQDVSSEKILLGKVKLDGNKLILADALGQPLPVEDTDKTTKKTTTFSLDVSADRKNLLLSIQTKNSSQVVRVYVKQ